MKLSYYPSQTQSVLHATTDDDMEAYDKLCAFVSAKIPDAALREYLIKQRRRNNGKDPKFKWNGKINFIQDAVFPSGLYFLIAQYLNKIGANYTTQIFAYPNELAVDRSVYNKLRPLQKEIIDGIVAHHQKYHFIRKIINIPIGAGKSYIIENFTSIFPHTTAIAVVAAQSLFKQYLDAGLNNAAKNGIKPFTVNLFMTSAYKKYNNEIINNIRNIDFLLLDEVHLEHVKSVVEKHPVYYLKKGLLAFTATLPTTKLEQLTLMQNTSSSIFMRKYTEAYDYKPTIQMLINDEQPPFNATYRDMVRFIMQSEKRMKLILSVIKRHKNKRVLLVTDKVDKGIKPLVNYLIAHNMDVKYVCGTQSIKQRDTILQWFRAHTGRVLVASAVLKAGINLAEADVIILNCQYKNSTPVIQFLGRLIRGNDPSITSKVFVDIYDKHFTQLREQAKCRIRTYKKSEWKVKIYK